MDRVILLIGGGSNLGKTTAATQIGAVSGADHIEVDALRTEFDDWPEHPFSEPDVWRRPVDVLLQALLEHTARIADALVGVIGDRAARGADAVIEGQGIEPRMLTRIGAGLQVRCVFVVEADPLRIAATLRGRDSQGGARYRALPPAEQEAVVAMNRRYNDWLRTEAVNHGLAWVGSQPWTTLADRITTVAKTGDR